jgi:hypothetical protein
MRQIRVPNVYILVFFITYPAIYFMLYENVLHERWLLCPKMHACLSLAQVTITSMSICVACGLMCTEHYGRDTAGEC